MCGPNYTNKNRRYRCYCTIAYTCGYTQRRQFFAATLEYVRSKFPSPDGRYSDDPKEQGA